MTWTTSIWRWRRSGNRQAGQRGRPADSSDGGCGPNPAWNATLDGARAELSADGKFLCAGNVHGLTVAVILTVHGTIRNPAGPDGALGYARKLHLLGSDPVGWTRNPLR
jgi:hypothetical protein